jgi:8-oxo-dGTP pyrophosphatase MutT (NUDIX family)
VSPGRQRSPRARRAPRTPKDTSGKAPTRREISAGGVVHRTADDGSIEVLLAARRTRKGELAWGLAKGGIEPDESPEIAAVREVREETGIEAAIEESLGETRYFYVWDDVRVRKVVHFFLMRATGGDPGDRDDEMEDVRWFPLSQALKRATYKGERDVLRRAADRLP